MKLLVFSLLVACSSRKAPAELGEDLRATAKLDAAARAKHVATWKLTREQWSATVNEPYAATYTDYTRAFDAIAPELATRLAGASDIVLRDHFAGDPLLTRAQARTRWALPVQYPAQVAMIAGAPLDAVFVKVTSGWGAIVGMDQILIDRIAARAPGCEVHLRTVGAKHCEEATWMVADAALGTDRPRLVRACSLAATACASVVKPTP